jgi:hypothetical protein
MKEDIDKHMVSYLHETRNTDIEAHLTQKEVVEQKYFKKRK